MRSWADRGSAGTSTMLLGPGWSSVTLALMLWGLALTGHLLFTLSLNANPLLLLFPFIWTAHGLLLTWPLHYVLRRTEERPGWTRWLAAGAAVVLLAALQALLDVQISGWVAQHLLPPGVGAAFVVLTPAGTIDAGLRISLMIYFWVFGCFAMADSLLLSQRKLIEAQGVAHRAGLAAMQLQLRPHFLFNALNSVSALIVTGRLDDAETTAMNLASFLRTTLLSDQDVLVTLADEMETLQAYLNVERARFGDRLIVETNVPEDLYDMAVPPFMLQLLVENAIKHAVAPTDRRVNIVLTASRWGDRLTLSVGDDGRGGPSVVSGTGTGLRNIRERLTAMYGPAASLTTNASHEGFTATITFPAASGTTAM